MNIATKYACQGQTCITTTSGPADECIFTTNDGLHTLNNSLIMIILYNIYIHHVQIKYIIVMVLVIWLKLQI